MPYQVPAALVKTVTGWLGAGHRLYGETETFEAAPTSENYSAPNW